MFKKTRKGRKGIENMQYKYKSNNMVNVSCIWNLKPKPNKLIDKEKIGGCQRKEVVVGQVD